MDLDIVTYGDLVADALLTIPRLPIRAAEEQIAHGMSSEPGGIGSFLIMAARFGGKAAPVGSLGDDLYGRMVFDKLGVEGVDLSALRLEPGQETTLVLVFVSDAGEHSFLGVMGTAKIGEAAWQAALEMTGRARAFFTNGYAFLESDPPERVVDLLRAARSRSALACFDPGPQVRSVERGLLRAAIAETDLLFATGEEAAALTGMAEAEQAAAALSALGPRTVVIKRGEAGCLISHGGDERLALPGFPVEVRDTAGAGDAFDAAFILGTVRGLPAEQAGCLANAVGAAAAARVGAGRRLPTREAVMDLLAQHGIAAPEI